MKGDTTRSLRGDAKRKRPTVLARLTQSSLALTIARGRRLAVRGRKFAVVAAAALAAAGALSAGGSGATKAASALPQCKLGGIRYAGAAAGKAGVCFTVSANRKAIREFAVDPCSAADVALGTSRFQKRVPIRAN